MIVAFFYFDLVFSYKNSILLVLLILHLSGQRRRDCEQQGGDEGVRHHRAGRQGVRRPLAQDCQQCLFYCLSHEIYVLLNFS